MKYNKRISIVSCYCIYILPIYFNFIGINAFDSYPGSKFTSVTD